MGIGGMQTNKNNISKEIIIETTLGLIDENGGIKNVTLRDIAKKIGCAHTNLYNYFNSLDEIFWESLADALLKMMYYCGNHLTTETDYEEELYSLLSNLIDFSMDYPGWYRLIWLETIGGNPSPEVAEILSMPGKELIKEITKASNSKFSAEKASLIYDILHGYLHGELCKWINSRSFINTREETKIKLLSNLKYLYKLMIQ
jgi:AcrR family transcriptional regulator